MSTELPPQRPLPTLARIPALFGGFTPLQSAFIDNYTGRGSDPNLTGNGTKSAKAAGYKGDDAACAVQANQLLRLPKIQQEIRRRLGTAVCSPGEVLETLSKHARADITDVIDSDGNFNLRKAKRKRLLKKLRTKKTVRYTRDGERIEETHTEYEIHDPQVALEKLGRFHQLFPTKVEISADDLDAAINAAIQAHSLPVIDVTPISEQGLQSSSLDQPAPLDHADGPVDQAHMDHD